MVARGVLYSPGIFTPSGLTGRLRLFSGSRGKRFGYFRLSNCVLSETVSAPHLGHCLSSWSHFRLHFSQMRCFKTVLRRLIMPPSVVMRKRHRHASLRQPSTCLGQKRLDLASLPK